MFSLLFRGLQSGIEFTASLLSREKLFLLYGSFLTAICQTAKLGNTLNSPLLLLAVKGAASQPLNLSVNKVNIMAVINKIIITEKSYLSTAKIYSSV